MTEQGKPDAVPPLTTRTAIKRIILDIRISPEGYRSMGTPTVNWIDSKGLVEANFGMNSKNFGVDIHSANWYFQSGSDFFF